MSKALWIVLIFLLSERLAPAAAQGPTENALSSLVVELIPSGERSVRYGEPVQFLASIKNRTDFDLAVCWSSLPEKSFLALQVLEGGRPVQLEKIPGETIAGYFFSPGRDIIILPGGSTQLTRLRLDTRSLPQASECTTYSILAQYWCPTSAEATWRGTPLLLTGKAQSRAVEIAVDDRFFWERWFSGACIP